MYVVVYYPLLASATSASHEIELLENTKGLSSKDALKIFKHVMTLSDLFILGNNGNFSEFEQEKKYAEWWNITTMSSFIYEILLMIIYI
ncbi:unnamed protein product [Rotaria sp. Silwood2]|nr:unnamed protein product [Rotaria sp. Silwood2]CAF3273730.1 unnamed protein product [Rotaria sp. Silwood2]CAF3486361.1 unnamed protein product [Rotaria sp. Silwood2]CAF4351959.1 unnamed protein product [Rotaria sp. Silwood2]CAF4356033.1 unnamed protein product [Rotaria sp. Silwood2]